MRRCFLLLSCILVVQGCTSDDYQDLGCQTLSTKQFERLDQNGLSLCRLSSPQDSKIDVIPEDTGYAVTVTPQDNPASWGSSYAALKFAAGGDHCSISVDSVAPPWKVAVARASDEVPIWSAAGSLSEGSVSDVFKVESNKYYYVIFYHPALDTSPQTYHKFTISCMQTGATPAVSLEDRINNEIVAPMISRQESVGIPRLADLITAFRFLADQVYNQVAAGVDDSEISNLLQQAYISDLNLLQDAHGLEMKDHDPRVVFAAYLAHFAVQFSHLDLDDTRSILLAKNGTCYQQAQVAAYFYKLLTGVELDIEGTDWLVLGHAIAVGPDFFIDVTDNVVVFKSASDWNDLSTVDRISVLKSSAVFGFSIGLDTSNPTQFVSEFGGADVVKAIVIEQVSHLPFAGIQIP